MDKSKKKFNVKRHQSITFSEIISSTGLQIKTDPGIPIIYGGFFFGAHARVPLFPEQSIYHARKIWILNDLTT